MANKKMVKTVRKPEVKNTPKKVRKAAKNAKAIGPKVNRRSVLPRPAIGKRAAPEGKKKPLKKISVQPLEAGAAKNVSINLDHITKIEGHAKLSVKITKGKVAQVHMAADVGLRDFERFLEGRSYTEAPEITERICGICSQAHTLAATTAIEKALKIKVSEQTKKLRHIVNLSAIFQSHVLHLYFLALPEYLGFGNAIDMAGKHMAEVKRALRLKRLSNDIVEAIGGREIHCFTMVIGGFSKIPTTEKMAELLRNVKTMKQDALLMAKLFGKLPYPDFKRKTQYVSLRFKDRYNFFEGNLISSSGISTSQEKYQAHLIESINEYSSAKELRLKGTSFLTGALARINNNLGAYSRNAKKVIKESKITFPNFNPFINNFAQAVEVVHIIDCLIELLSGLKLKDEAPATANVKAGRGISIIEVPRGILIHDYTLDAEGLITKANIVAPTTMNLHNIEDDIKELLPQIMDREREHIVAEFEKLIRSYDPCISCSTHFLEMEWL